MPGSPSRIQASVARRSSATVLVRERASFAGSLGIVAFGSGRAGCDTADCSGADCSGADCAAV